MKSIVLLLSLITSFTTFATDFPDENSPFKYFMIDSDSGIRGPTYSKIVDELKSLEATYGDYAKVITYGKTIKSRPLTLIKIFRKDVTSDNKKAIYIGGSIHGDEYLNIEDRLPRWFLDQTSVSSNVSTFLNQGGTIYIAPILNPDGYDNRSRENGRGVDLNRDYTVITANVEGFKEIETKSLIDYLKKDLATTNRKLAIAMDYHCCIGALLYPWSFTGPVLTNLEMNKHLEIANIMHTTIGTSMRAGTTPVILGYSAKGTSKDFYFEHFGALGFTYEGRRRQEDKFFEEHTSMWDGIIKTLIE